MSSSDGDRARRLMQQILEYRAPKQIRFEPGFHRQAAVLIPFLEHCGAFHVLLTKRSAVLSQHRGQISFPGGGLEPFDSSPEDAALREAYEEIGLRKEDVKIIGRMDDARTLTSNFVVSPVVGWIPFPYEFKINSAEVERLIPVPLKAFDPRRSEPRKRLIQSEDRSYVSPAYKFKEERIWGATARIMENLMNTIGLKLLLLEEQK